LAKRDFSYRFYENTLKELQKNHEFVFLDNVSNNDVILRHDIDIALEPALKMAKIENKLGISSTFFILFQSSFYNPFSVSSLKIIKEILDLDHRIGFHYDSSVYIKNHLRPKEIIMKEIDIMNKYYDTSIREIAAHNPTTNDKLKIILPGIIDADSKKFKENRKYLSDSVQNWREGSFSNYISEKNLYILIHPIWWSKDNLKREEILKSFSGGKLDPHKKEVEQLTIFQNNYLSRLK